MKDWNANKDTNANGDRWIVWEAAFVGLLIVLAVVGVLCNAIVALV